MLFRRAVLSSFALIVSSSVLSIYFLVRVLPADREKYQKLEKATSYLRSSKALERHPACQERENAQKDVWTVDGSERRHYQVFAKHSTLSVRQKKERMEASENLEGIFCSLNDPQKNPFSQNVSGVIRASHGFYEYPDNRFFATKVECLHELGKLTSEKATLEPESENGQSPNLSLEEHVVFTTLGQNIPFSIQSDEARCPFSQKKMFSLPKIEFLRHVAIQSVEGLLARGGYAVYKEGSLTLYPEVPKLYCHMEKSSARVDASEIAFDLKKEQIYCKMAKGSIDFPKEGPLLFFSDELLWTKAKEKISLKKNVMIERQGQFSVEADFAQIALLNNEEISRLEVIDHVRLFSSRIQNKDSFALADNIVFSPRAQTIHLFAKAPKRVLFWQEGVSLSAPEIFIEKDPLTGIEFIQGKGDIHFTFTLEEKNIMDQFISKYL